MFFLPPTFEFPLPPRAHSSSRHNLRAPDLGGASRRARSACTRGRRRRPVARSVCSARRPLPLAILSSLCTGGVSSVDRSRPCKFPQGALDSPDLQSQLAVGSSCRRPAGGGVQGAPPRQVGDLEFELTTCHSPPAYISPCSDASGRPLG